MDEVETPAPQPDRHRVYQIRTPGAQEWLELDRDAWQRVRNVRTFDRRILAVVDEEIVG
jgi:hypothetical protein